jgi:hypothetical protein
MSISVRTRPFSQGTRRRDSGLVSIRVLPGWAGIVGPFKLVLTKQIDSLVSQPMATNQSHPSITLI